MDSVALLQLADVYNTPRLVNLCELYITKEVDRSVSKNIEKSEIDVIGLLLISQVVATLCLFYTCDGDTREKYFLKFLKSLWCVLCANEKLTSTD